MKINCHTDFQPLKEIIVGRTYHEHSFDFIKEDRIKSPLKRILEETNKDLDNLCTVLKEHDITVYRPGTPPKGLLQECVIGNRKPPIPSLAIRDGYITVANTLYRFVYKEEMNPMFNMPVNQGNLFDPYRNEKDLKSLKKLTKKEFNSIVQELASRDNRQTMYRKNQGKMIPGMNPEHLKIRTNMIDAPCLVRLGNRLIVDNFPSYQQQWIQERFKEYDIVYTNIGGHSDGVFCPITPGLYVHTKDFEEFKNTVPGWEGIYLHKQGWESDVVKGFEKIKYSNQGKWWIQGEETNAMLIDFVEKWLDEWVGYIEESVFDVNMLSINENLILCTNEPPKELKAAFKKHKVEYIVTPFRHRYFWDGGLHCITLDINREGGREDYFS
jgi:hypothetical protein